MEDKNIEEYIGKELSGAEFNEYFPDMSKKLIKLTNPMECHNRFYFQTGLNKDEKKFNPTRECQPGGIYFTDIHNLPIWLHYDFFGMKYYRYVTLPDDCRVYVEKNKIKADKIILSKRGDISELQIWDDEDYCLNALRIGNYDEVKKYIRKFNIEIQLYILERDGRSNCLNCLTYLLDKGVKLSEELLMAAVKIEPFLIKCLLIKILNNRKIEIEISENIQIAAVKNCFAGLYYLIEHNIKLSEKVQIAAIEGNRDRSIIMYLLDNKIDVSEEAQIVAAKRDHRSIKHLLNYGVKVTQKVQMTALELDYHAINYLLLHKLEVSEEIKLYAVKKCYKAIFYFMYYDAYISENIKKAVTEKCGLRFEDLEKKFEDQKKKFGYLKENFEENPSRSDPDFLRILIDIFF